MTTRLTLFTATLVQDSALSVSGLDRESTADQPFALVDGVPTLVGRGLKGAAVAMAARFFKELPLALSDSIRPGEKRALRRSAWEFADAKLTRVVAPQLRAGVGIRQKTGARAGGVLYDREVIPAGTKWELTFRVNWSHVANDDEGREAEGILGYVLTEHWAKGRCWLGGCSARGLGWCHVEDLKTHRFDDVAYEVWVQAGRPRVPQVRAIEVPTVEPTRSWCFRTLDVDISFGEYKPEPSEAAWGLDMFAVGPHDTERAVQSTGGGKWVRPAWAPNANDPSKWLDDKETPKDLSTDRALLMEGGRPLLPGASVRGPLRHAFSRDENARAGELIVEDPHRKDGQMSADDLKGNAFGTVSQSSRILIRDAQAQGEWAAAKLHMHAEDEFSAGSYGSAKRDAVRLLKGTFPLRIVVEGDGSKPEEVAQLVELVDRQVALGALGHLLIGGHKTRGAGAGHWQAQPWINDDVIKSSRTWARPIEAEPSSAPNLQRKPKLSEPRDPIQALVRTDHGAFNGVLTLGEAARVAKVALAAEALVAWWCEPTIDLSIDVPPATFGRTWPDEATLEVDEVAFYAERAVWRAARTSTGARFVFIQEGDGGEAKPANVVFTPARLHRGSTAPPGKEPRFTSADTGDGSVLLREWHSEGKVLGFTINTEGL